MAIGGMASICVDASLILECLFEDERHDQAVAMLRKWLDDGVDLVAPNFMIWEIGSVLRGRARRGGMMPESARRALWAVGRLPIRAIHNFEVVQRAWEIATRFNLPTVYDACYLAVAEAVTAEFWTADKNLARTVEKDLSYVRLL